MLIQTSTKDGHLVFLVLGEVIRLVRDAIAEQGGPRRFHLRAAENSFHLFFELMETIPGCSVGGARWRPTRPPPTSKDVVHGIGRATQVFCQDQLTNNLN